MSTKITLSKSIQAHGEEVTELTLREPTAGDVMELGAHQQFAPSSDGVSVQFRPGVIGQYIAKLAAIPMSSVKALSPKDFAKCQRAVADFLSDDGDNLTPTTLSQ